MVGVLVRSVLSDVEKDFRELGRLNSKAAFRAIRVAQRRARSLISRRVAQFNGFPVRIVRQRIYTPRPVRRRDSATVWVHTLPIRARHFSRSDPRQTKAGAIVGRVRFPGAFVFRGRASSKLLVGKRKGRKRLPIVEPTKRMRGAEEIADTVIRIDARVAFNTEFERQMALLL